MIPAFLIRLMTRAKIPMHWKVQTEERICIEFADELRIATLEGRVMFAWCHIPNEGKRHPVIAIVMKAMGLIPGFTDFVFLAEDMAAVIEFKVKGNKLSENQELVRQWCEYLKIPHAVCYSAQEGWDFLVRVGMLGASTTVNVIKQ